MLTASFLIPTKRDHETHSRRVIHSINQNFKEPHEILVYSRLPIKGKYIRWIREHRPKGPLFGFNHLCQFAEGRYIFIMCDDGELVDGYNAIKKIEELPKDAKFHISGLKHAGHYVYNSQETGTPMIGNPVVRRDTLDREFGGKVFNKYFKYHYADCWMTYYCYKQGQPLEMSESSINIFHGESGVSPAENAYDHEMYLRIVQEYDGTYHAR